MPLSRSELVAFISGNLPVSPVRGVPEIRLHLAGPSSGLGRLGERIGDGAGPPYWAYTWGGGLALARHILDNPQTVAGRRIVDIGTGSGIVAIAAAKAGASKVTAIDSDPNALAAVSINASLNGVDVVAMPGNASDGPPADADLVTVADLFYDRDLAAHVTACLDGCLEAGIDVLVADPFRPFLPQERLRLAAEYAVADFGSSGSSATSRAGVFTFVAPPEAAGIPDVVSPGHCGTR